MTFWQMLPNFMALHDFITLEIVNSNKGEYKFKLSLKYNMGACAYHGVID